MMSIPIISPIEINIPANTAKLLPAPEEVQEELSLEEPDYTVHDVEPPPLFIASPALMALNEVEHALEISEYHDFGWWRQRLEVIRTQIKQPRPVDVPKAGDAQAADEQSADSSADDLATDPTHAPPTDDPTTE